MISWIQQTFQNHFRTIFAVLLAFIIVSFVFTIGASPGLGRADRKAMVRPFFGLNLGSAEDAQRLGTDGSLSLQLRFGIPGVDGAQLEEFALQRHALIALADQLHLPQPGRQEVTDHIRGMRAFATPEGSFDARKYDEFKKSLSKGGDRLTEADVLRVIAGDIRAQKAQELLGGPGYLLTHEIADQIERAETQWTIQVASLDYDSFSPALTPTEDALKRHFEANTFRFELPPEVRVDMVEFPAGAFAAGISVTPDEVRAAYDANPARWSAPSADGKPVAATEAGFAAARPQIEALLGFQKAQRVAAQAASDLAVELFDKKVSPEQVADSVSARGLKVQALPALSRASLPVQFGGNPQALEEAFRLSKSRPFSDPVPTLQGVALLVWRESIPSRTPQFVEVRANVEADFRESEKRRLFVEFGRTLKAAVQAKVSAGSAFDAAVASASGATKVETKAYGPFTLRQPPQGADYAALNALASLGKGQVSDMLLSSASRGLLVHVADKKAPEVTEAHPQFVQTRTQLGQITAGRASGDVLRALVAGELAKSAPPAR